MTEGAMTWTASEDHHPARLASRRSMEAAARKDKAGWLALYADDALVEDPVGPSPLDPEGHGHRGHDRLSAFWDATIATTERLDFEIVESLVSGDEVANVGSVTAYLPGNMRMRTDGIYVYRVDKAGRIISLRTFWEFDRAMATLAQIDPT
jgi:ketosteroid isomerase-like protein